MIITDCNEYKYVCTIVIYAKTEKKNQLKGNIIIIFDSYEYKKNCN